MASGGRGKGKKVEKKGGKKKRRGREKEEARKVVN